MMQSRRFLPAALMLLSILAVTPSAAQSQGVVGIDRIAAVVNSEAITELELQEQVRIVQRQLRDQSIEVPAADLLERQVLERMIVDRAQMQLARESGVRIDDAQIERAVAAIAADNGLDVAQLRDRLRRENIDFEVFREQVRGQIVRQRLREREIDSRIQISDADIDAFLASQAKGAQSGDELHIAQILLRIPEGASAEDIERERMRGEEIVRQLQAGADFGRLSAAFSDAPEAMSGGSLGWRTPDRLPELFVEAVASLRPGTVAPLQRSAAGFHVLKLLERRSADPATPAASAAQSVVQTHTRHILIRPNEIVGEDEAIRRLREIRQRVQSGDGDFAELARQYSVDGSAGRGGDLGWVYPGDTVPEFERAMNALAPGQISDPVRTPFGVHLIQVVERRTDTSSPDRVRQQARQVLRERRIDENYEDWLRQLRDRTYVEYKLEQHAQASQSSGGQ